MSSEALQTWSDPATGLKYTRSGNGSWQCVASPRPSGSLINTNLMVWDTMGQFSVRPTCGPNDSPFPPGQHPSSTSASSNTLPQIDPALISLPNDGPDDFPPPSRILPRIAHPASKIAGSRRPLTSAKGKQRAVDPIPVAGSSKRKGSVMRVEEPDTKKRRGRGPGVANYSAEDVDALLDIIEDRLPIGGHAWNSAADEFAQWAEENSRPVRTAKSLEAKFKQFVRTTKPTGDAECPPHIERAHFIEDQINEKAGTRELDDVDIVDAYEDPIEISHSIGYLLVMTKTKMKTFHLELLLSHNLNDAQDLLSTISSALNPTTQTAREDDRASRAMHTTQLLTMSQQIRDAQATIEGLRNRLQEADRECHAAERRADRAELMSMISAPDSSSDISELNFNVRDIGIPLIRFTITYHSLRAECSARLSTEHAASKRWFCCLFDHVYISCYVASSFANLHKINGTCGLFCRPDGSCINKRFQCCGRSKLAGRCAIKSEVCGCRQVKISKSPFFISNMSSEALQTWSDPATGLKYTRSGNGSWQCVASPRPSGSLINTNLMVRDTTGQFSVRPTCGPNDSPFPPGQHPSSTSASSNTLPQIDPALISLPNDGPDDFPPPSRILPRIAHPASKIAGSRRPLTSAKGKQRAVDPIPVAGSSKRKGSVMRVEEPDTKKRRGRGPGVANYSAEDVDALLDIIEDRLPIGGHAWNSAADEFAQWAEENSRPVRTAKSLEAKFKQFVRTTKPTGDAECPPHIERAHFIEDQINEKAGTRELDDVDIVDAYEDPIEISHSIGYLLVMTKTKMKTFHLELLLSHNLNDAQDLLSTISSALNPTTQTAREDDRASRAMHTTQLLTMSQQIRDAQATIEGLRNRLQEADRECHAAERRADRAELMSMISAMQARSLHRGPQAPSSPLATRLMRPADLLSHVKSLAPMAQLTKTELENGKLFTEHATHVFDLALFESLSHVLSDFLWKGTSPSMGDIHGIAVKAWINLQSNQLTNKDFINSFAITQKNWPGVTEYEKAATDPWAVGAKAAGRRGWYFQQLQKAIPTFVSGSFKTFKFLTMTAGYKESLGSWTSLIYWHVALPQDPTSPPTLDKGQLASPHLAVAAKAFYENFSQPPSKYRSIIMTALNRMQGASATATHYAFPLHSIIFPCAIMRGEFHFQLQGWHDRCGPDPWEAQIFLNIETDDRAFIGPNEGKSLREMVGPNGPIIKLRLMVGPNVGPNGKISMLWLVAMRARSCSVTPADQQLIHYTLVLAVVHYSHRAALVPLALGAWFIAWALTCCVTWHLRVVLTALQRAVIVESAMQARSLHRGPQAPSSPLATRLMRPADLLSHVKSLAPMAQLTKTELENGKLFTEHATHVFDLALFESLSHVLSDFLWKGTSPSMGDIHGIAVKAWINLQSNQLTNKDFINSFAITQKNWPGVTEYEKAATDPWAVGAKAAGRRGWYFQQLQKAIPTFVSGSFKTFKFLTMTAGYKESLGSWTSLIYWHVALPQDPTSPPTLDKGQLASPHLAVAAKAFYENFSQPPSKYRSIIMTALNRMQGASATATHYAFPLHSIIFPCAIMRGEFHFQLQGWHDRCGPDPWEAQIFLNIETDAGHSVGPNGKISMLWLVWALVWVALVTLPLRVATWARSCSVTPADQQLIHYTLGLAVVHYPHGAALVPLALWVATWARLCSVTPRVDNRSITPAGSYSVTPTMSSSCSLRPAEPSSVWPTGFQLQPRTICGSPAGLQLQPRTICGSPAGLRLHPRITCCSVTPAATHRPPAAP
ncbi:uncharacterized protein LACBIDRAFT_332618 [Laccaria bicolor S238N-H82]|uniref:Predicted protein n=1 Tax=Laccaria bicolor (strain S238N-H82 / ATCC MYA-4686) TaxID=486041 RepID=B0DTD2_LACBS|nr:uncharacterized protein LACBIDRAFT_332618 [Laccaria bicolor S238N-H82]EDR02255.1 predicted protein [Laccaria bicolor S238N-H82]|eukprot:XP_001887200.1 predicted protein [Laccaria bicolor S238N-H82]